MVAPRTSQPIAVLGVETGRGSRRRQISRVVFLAIAVEAAVVMLMLVINLVTSSAPADWQVYIVPVTGILSAGVKAGAEALAGGEKWPEPIPSAPVARHRSRHASQFVVMVALLTVVGGGGLFTAVGVGYTYGWLTGNEKGVEVYSGRLSDTSGTLKLTVTRAVVTAHFTRLEVTLTNSGRNSVSVPLFRTCQLISEAGETLAADPFRSEWSDVVPPSVPILGTIVFSGRIPAGTATLSFGMVFHSESTGGAEPLLVRGIPIQPH